MSDWLIEDWLASACADADRRGLPALKPLLSALADATRALRAVDWYEALSATPSAWPSATRGLKTPGYEEEPDADREAQQPRDEATPDADRRPQQPGDEAHPGDGAPR